MAQTILHERPEEFTDIRPGISAIVAQPHEKMAMMMPHWHERLEIWRVQKGCLNVVCDREAVTVQTGDIVIFNPCEIHSSLATIDSVVDVYLINLDEFVGKNHEIEAIIINLLCGDIRFCHRIKDCPKLWNILEEFTGLYAADAGNPALSMLLFGLLYLFLGILRQKYVFIQAAHERHKKNDAMSLILNYISVNYSKRITLDDMASYLCLSRSYFCRWFKRQTGDSPINYLNAVRVQHACELLCSTGLPITEICFQTGFADIHSFNRLFKKRMAMTPSQVRRHVEAKDGTVDSKENAPVG